MLIKFAVDEFKHKKCNKGYCIHLSNVFWNLFVFCGLSLVSILHSFVQRESGHLPHKTPKSKCGERFLWNVYHGSRSVKWINHRVFMDSSRLSPISDNRTCTWSELFSVSFTIIDTVLVGNRDVVCSHFFHIHSFLFSVHPSTAPSLPSSLSLLVHLQRLPQGFTRNPKKPAKT